MRISAEPLIPFALWIALAIAAALVMIWYERTNRIVNNRYRKTAIVALMSLSLLVPLVVLLNPTIVHTIPPPAGKPVLDVVIDYSASMLTDDVDGESRIATAAETAKKLVDQLEDHFDIRLSAFGSELSALAGLEDAGSSNEFDSRTNIGSAIADAIKDVAPQGHSVLLISDGIHNSDSVSNVIESAKRAKAMNVPVYTMTLGGDVGVKNVAVQMRSPQELAFVDQIVPVTVGITSSGLRAADLEVSLWKGKEIVDKKSVQVDEQARSTEATFDLSEEKTGLYRFQISVDEISGEATVADNRATMLLRVVDEPVQVLLLEGKPYWDTKFLTRKLASDKSIQLNSLVKLTEGRYLQRVIKREKDSLDEITSTESSKILSDVTQFLSSANLKKNQIVILGRDAEVFLTEDFLETMRDWISREGGSLVCSRGAPSAQITERLATIMPVNWTTSREQRFRVRLTKSGRDLRWLAAIGKTDVLATMPTLVSAATPTAKAGLSNVLVAANDGQSENSPVVSFQTYGVGRTIVVEGAGMWRWALLAPRHQDRDQIYEALWRNLLRWLVSRAGLLPGQDISLQADRVSFESGGVATATMLVRSDSAANLPVIELLLPDKSIREYQAKPGGQDPGVFRVEFPDLDAGSYSAEAVDAQSGNRDVLASTAFDVRDSWVENLELDARHDLMNRIANETGGAVVLANDSGSFVADFKEHLQKLHPKRVRREKVWDRWWFLLAAFGLWAAGWIVRRKSGLV